MSNSLSLDPFVSDNPSQTKSKKSLSDWLGIGLGKVVVSTRHKLSGVGKAIHRSIENDVEDRLSEQAGYYIEQLRQQDMLRDEEITDLKKRQLKITIVMTLIGLLMGFVAASILFWYY